MFDEIKNHRKQNGQSDATLYYISTGYAYGIYNKRIPEDFPDFKPGTPDNTYAQTKAEAKIFILDKINRLNDRIVLFEPTIIGGAARTGKTKTYNLTMYKITGKKKYRKMVVGVRLLEGYFPYITRYKVFENSKSTQLLEKYTDYPKAPILQNIKDKNGNLVKKGYIDKILADTLETGWGGMVDYARVAAQVAGAKRNKVK